MKKEMIIEAVQQLLASAQARRTNQGVLVYTRVLQMLELAKDSTEIEEVRSKLNKALVGIEAHGDLTESEFVIIRNLRN